ncbi:MAG: hypothetical protein KC800_12150 [Candidatus Eremiobacteraeota bacterium]|nr:hypothetical protein [Candidatus Eremiobacteraeota bacterium]
MTAPEIIDKLKPKLREEGLEVDFLGREGAIVNIRAKRVAPGVPVAFLVKAIAGTYRRYLPEIEDVCLAEYDPGEAIGTAPSETFEPVFQHKPVAAGLHLQGLPVIDLSGLDRRQAVQALENFFRVWSQKSPVLGVEGLHQDAPLRAMKKWASVYRDDYSETQVVSDGRWNILIAAGTDESVKKMLTQSDERMPGKIFILLAEDSE